MELEQTSLGGPPKSRVDTVDKLRRSHAGEGATPQPIGPRPPVLTKSLMHPPLANYALLIAKVTRRLQSDPALVECPAVFPAEDFLVCRCKSVWGRP